ncbi:hypothetical protein QVD17_25790 [Tagetes erecta]|uniref:Uncharacterized protein n=1 Tax=Tagetes erecta TaxID=13708 RepID=A0AAD8K5A1_TARER|nr:hypothetical protein QVD17_25790 [Tagetes erecta]
MPIGSNTARIFVTENSWRQAGCKIWKRSSSTNHPFHHIIFISRRLSTSTRSIRLHKSSISPHNLHLRSSPVVQFTAGSLVPH